MDNLLLKPEVWAKTAAGAARWHDAKKRCETPCFGMLCTAGSAAFLLTVSIPAAAYKATRSSDFDMIRMCAPTGDTQR